MRAIGLLALVAACATLHAAAQQAPPVPYLYAQLWDCEPGNPLQQWDLPDGAHLVLLRANRAFALDVDHYGTAAGSLLRALPARPNETNPKQRSQRWAYSAQNQTLLNELSGLAAAAGSNDTGARLWLGVAGSPAARWAYNQSDGSFRNAASNRCLDAGSMRSCQDAALSSLPFCDPTRPTADRTADLLGRMTLQEKIELMSSSGGDERTHGTPRLALPGFYHTECTHGTLNDGSLLTTLFPQAITAARSFNRDLLHLTGRAISDEVRGKHNAGKQQGNPGYPNGLYCWAPVVNICRDPRWGRCQEGYGEDPFLNAELSVQYVRGIQFGPDPRHLEAVATCKHFDVHSGPENIPESRFTFDAKVSFADWVMTYQPAFEACGRRGGAASYMCSYNSITVPGLPSQQAVPACANTGLLQDLLRGEWNWTGMVVSDCGAVENIYTQHHYVSSLANATAVAVRAGTDQNCGNAYSAGLPDALSQGLLNSSDIDRSASRIIDLQLRLGLLDPPDQVPYNDIDLKTVVNAHRDLVLQSALQSIVLLENKNGLLPLDPTADRVVALVGPCADDSSCYTGDYNAEPPYLITLRDAINDRQPSWLVKFAPGCANVKCASSAGFAAAVAAASQADIVIFAGGISRDIESEARDRDSLLLPGRQEELVQQLVATGKPVVAVLFHGAVIAANWTFDNAAAVLSAGYPGQEGGSALQLVLTGQHNPGARTANTWYTGLAQVPPMTDYNMSSSPGRTYRYLRPDVKPRYPFGHGLSYTSWQYSNLTVDAGNKLCDPITVSVAVTNTGPLAGDVVTLVFSNRSSSAPVPLLELVGFDSTLNVSPAQSVQLRFSVSARQLAVTSSPQFHKMLEPGVFSLYVGNVSPLAVNWAGLHADTTRVGSVVPLSNCPVDA